MRKALTIIITILTCITAFMSVIIFSTNYMISKKSTVKIIKTIQPQTLLEQIAPTNHIDTLYEEASRYNISKEQVDKIVASPEFRNYVSEIIEEIIQNKLNNSTLSVHEIEKITDTFIQEAITKYQLDISPNNTEELKEITSNTITETANELTQQDSSEENMAILHFVKFCNTTSTKSIFIIILIIEAILIIILSWPKKSFLSYFSFIHLFLSIFTVILVIAFHLGLSIIEEETNVLLTSVFQPLVQDGYKLSAIFIGIAIILLIIHKLIMKRIDEYQQIPF